MFLSDISWRVLLLRYAPVVFWLGVIFLLSSGTGSAIETSRIIGPLLKFFFPSLEPATAQFIHGLIRKAAHVTEYAVLAALAARAFKSTAVAWLNRYWLIWAVLLVVITATTDELNQSFNRRRTGSGWDVVLDISGGLLGMSLFWLWTRRRNEENQPDSLEPEN